MKFKEFIEELFMSKEDKDAKNAPEVIEEVKLEDEVVVDEVVDAPEVEAKVDDVPKVIEDVIEDETPDYMLKADVEELVSGIVDKTLERINLAKEAREELKLSLEADNKGLSERLEKLELELQKPGKAPEVVIPPVKGNKDTDNWSMAGAVKRNK